MEIVMHLAVCLPFAVIGFVLGILYKTKAIAAANAAAHVAEHLVKKVL